MQYLLQGLELTQSLKLGLTNIRLKRAFSLGGKGLLEGILEFPRNLKAATIRQIYFLTENLVATI